MKNLMRMISRYKWFIAILVIGAVLRFWQLGAVPASVDWDEAALGFNAYSILKTGRDEYGTQFPLTIRSFDDYKPPLYVYLTIPSVAAFGVSPWSVRLPSAVMGLLAIAGTYFLARELRKSEPFSLLASLFLAISPWHIQFSRIAFEANSGVAINIWAVFCFLKGLKSRSWSVISAILFGLGLYAYHSQRIFLPLLVIVLFVIYRKTLIKQWKQTLVFVVVGLITVAPLIPVFFNQTTLTRLRGTSSLADQTQLLKRSVAKLEYDVRQGNPWGFIYDNRRIEWAKTLVSGYLSHYSARWLFLTGDNARHHAPDMGLLYLWELPFVVWGIYVIMKKGDAASKLLGGWFLIAPVAASPTTELPHAIRTLVFLPTFQLFSAAGVLAFIEFMRQKRSYIYSFFLYVIFLLGVVNVIFYLHMYFVHMDHEYSQYWQYGYEQAVAYADTHKSKYKKIVVSTKLEQPHMFFLFYLRYDPVTYLGEGGTASGGFEEVRNSFDIYEFRPIYWEQEIKDGSVLYIGKPEEVQSTPLVTIYYLNGQEAIKIADH